MTPDEAVAALAAAGCVAADLDAADLVAAACAGVGSLEELVARRSAGEPVATIVGWIDFGPVRIHVDPGAYVPRLQSLPMALAAADALPPHGVAVDLCTGTGAIAATMRALRPQATVLATDLCRRAVANARANGVVADAGDLYDPLPSPVRGAVDVITAVAPYVPTPALGMLPRDVVAFEPAAALDGGGDGLDVLRPVIDGARHWLAPAGTLFVELGGDQGPPVSTLLAAAGLDDITLHHDDDGDLRWATGRWPVAGSTTAHPPPVRSRAARRSR